MFHSDLQKLLFHISQNGRTDLTQPTLHYWPSATEDKRHGWNNWWEMPLDSGPNHILYTSSGSQSYSLQIKCADQPFSRGSCKNCLKSTKSTIFRNYWYSLIIWFVSPSQLLGLDIKTFMLRSFSSLAALNLTKTLSKKHIYMLSSGHDAKLIELDVDTMASQCTNILVIFPFQICISLLFEAFVNWNQQASKYLHLMR